MTTEAMISAGYKAYDEHGSITDAFEAMIAASKSYIVVYRKHHELRLDTRYIGPFFTYSEAVTALEALPAVGIFVHDDDPCQEHGVKFVQELTFDRP